MVDRDRPSFPRRWGRFVQERFAPGPHLLLIAAFFVGNAPDAWRRPESVGWATIAAAAAATVLVFLRLRIFDEIKDLDTDRVLRPDRPLARGLITPTEAKRVAACVAVAEGLLAASCGPGAFVAWGAVLAFSLLMYREFFAGPWLRPRMELYAITHTFVVVGIGAFVALAVGAARDGAPGTPELVVAAAGNWAIFNVYEFARKTHAPSEERPGIETYSSRHGPRGAVVLTMVNLAAAVAAAGGLVGNDAGVLTRPVVAGGGLIAASVCALPYLVRPVPWTAVWFRTGIGLSMAAYYVLLATSPRGPGWGG